MEGERRGTQSGGRKMRKGDGASRLLKFTSRRVKKLSRERTTLGSLVRRPREARKSTRFLSNLKACCRAIFERFT